MGLQVNGVRSAGINHHFEQVSNKLRNALSVPTKHGYLLLFSKPNPTVWG